MTGVPPEGQVLTGIALTAAQTGFSALQVDVNQAALDKAGVPEGEIVATSMDIEPRERYDAKSEEDVYEGMGVSREITARFADLDALMGGALQFEILAALLAQDSRGMHDAADPAERAGLPRQRRHQRVPAAPLA